MQQIVKRSVKARLAALILLGSILEESVTATILLIFRVSIDKGKYSQLLFYAPQMTTNCMMKTQYLAPPLVPTPQKGQLIPRQKRPF